MQVLLEIETLDQFTEFVNRNSQVAPENIQITGDPEVVATAERLRGVLIDVYQMAKSYTWEPTGALTPCVFPEEFKEESFKNYPADPNAYMPVVDETLFLGDPHMKVSHEVRGAQRVPASIQEDNYNRLSTVREKILHTLKEVGQIGATNIDLLQICIRYSSRIHELRSQGYSITKQYVSPLKKIGKTVRRNESGVPVLYAIGFAVGFVVCALVGYLIGSSSVQF
jgi:hypothetical protein